MVPCFECSIAVKWLVKLGLSFYVYVAVDEFFYSTLLGLNDFFISSFSFNLVDLYVPYILYIHEQ